MMDFWTAMVVAPIVSLWFGFFLERGYRQGTTYNLIGYASKIGLNSKRAERAVYKHFGKWDWLLLAFAFYCGALAIIFHLHGMNMMLVVALSVLGGGAFMRCFLNLSHHYKQAQCELS
ncbi:MAG: hypothetical protein M3R03_09570 [Pseudomonadota bacterium]|nr:hypothetical protein [Pseudomonadota bacterium]